MDYKLLIDGGEAMTKTPALALTDLPRQQDKRIADTRTDVGKAETTKTKTGRPKYRRRTIELHPDMEKLLDSIQSDLKLRSQTEVMQKAIQFLGFVLGKEDGKKKKIFVEQENGKLRELVIL